MPSLKVALVRSHQLGLVDADGIVEVLDVRQRRLADADDADLVGFDEARRDSDWAAAAMTSAGRGHPAGGAAAEDHDFEGLFHDLILSRPS